MDQTGKEWLDERFLLDCIKGNNAESGPVVMTSCDVQPGVAPGNNYGSEILRVKVHYKEGDDSTEKSISLIVKAPVTNNIAHAMISLFGRAEYHFYYMYLPKLNNLIKDHITAKAYFTSIQSVIVLEDLKEAGFTMADRQKQLDYNHCKLYFNASAKFHAAGVFLAKHNSELLDTFPDMFERVKNSGDYTQLEIFVQDMLVAFKCLIKTVEQLGLDEYKPYIETIKKFVELNTTSGDDYLKMSLIALTEKNKTTFKSFIHGDCWTTNMMFKQEKSGKPIDIRLLDFQGFHYDTVVTDINNFTWLSCNNEVLEYHLDELYNIYCDTLNSNLAELGCSERLSFARLKEEISINSHQILTMGCMLLPIILNDELMDTTSMFSGKGKEEDFIKYYQGERFHNKFPRVLKFMAKHGVFDSIEKDLLQWKQHEDQLNSS